MDLDEYFPGQGGTTFFVETPHTGLIGEFSSVQRIDAIRKKDDSSETPRYVPVMVRTATVADLKLASELKGKEIRPLIMTPIRSLKDLLGTEGVQRVTEQLYREDQEFIKSLRDQGSDGDGGFHKTYTLPDIRSIYRQ